VLNIIRKKSTQKNIKKKRNGLVMQELRMADRKEVWAGHYCLTEEKDMMVPTT
jgi:hypothetical protein